uniref:Biosis of lysosomal organelles complex 1 subunit 4 n=1 Tax=Nothoprocta perdicaria TaxID=30464 RepID=A0A8C6YSL4_NOTPE
LQRAGERRAAVPRSRRRRLGVFACFHPALKCVLQVESFEESLEDLLTRVDEFVGMLDMIRSDSSQVVNESLPEIYTKATEMRHIYRKIDKLEAFVKMVGNCVAEMEERVTKAETDLGAFPSTFKKILHTISLPAFLRRWECGEVKVKCNLNALNPTI